jgi:hypothetical protein
MDLSRASGVGAYANNVAYVGRASFRIVEDKPSLDGEESGVVVEPMQSGITARIGTRPPIHFEPPASGLEPELRAVDFEQGWRLRIALPVWVYGVLGIVAFATGLLVAAAMNQ